MPVEVKVENLLALTKEETASKTQWLNKHKPLKVRIRSLMDQLQAIKIRTNRKAETEIRNQMDTIVVCLAKALLQM